jgi:hypothetical protein
MLSTDCLSVIYEYCGLEFVLSYYRYDQNAYNKYLRIIKFRYPDLNYCVINNHYYSFKYILNKTDNLESNIIETIINCRNFKFFKDLITKCEYDSKLTNYVIENRCIGIIKYIVSNGHQINDANILSAISSGSYKIFKYLIRKYKFDSSRFEDRYLIDYAVKRQNLKVVKFLYSIGGSCTNIEKNGVYWSCYYGNLKFLKYLIRMEEVIRADHILVAYRKDNCRVLKYLKSEKLIPQDSVLLKSIILRI